MVCSQIQFEKLTLLVKFCVCAVKKQRAESVQRSKHFDLARMHSCIMNGGGKLALKTFARV